MLPSTYLPYLACLGASATGAAAAACPYSSSSSSSSSPRQCPYSTTSTSSSPDLLSPRSALTPRAPAASKKGVFFMNRLAPSWSSLYIAAADGSGTETLLLSTNDTLDYAASWSADGQWVVFTSERAGDGNADLYRVRVGNSTGGGGKRDGGGVVVGEPEVLANTSAVETAGALSPNGSLLAFQATRGNLQSHIWLMDVASGESWNITNTPLTPSFNTSLPSGHFRPSWSPSGTHLVFSSDRNTPWRGHNGTAGWEHTQALSVYAIAADGTGFRQVSTRSGYSQGAPKFSPDGQRVVFYEMPVESTFLARRPESVDNVASQIVSVDFATGEDRVVHTAGGGAKMQPQYVNNDTIGFLVKSSGAAAQGLNYTSAARDDAPSTYPSAGGGNLTEMLGAMRSPSWSPDGKLVVYHKTSNDPVRKQDSALYSWDAEWEYRYTDVMPALSPSLNNTSAPHLAMTAQQSGNSSVVLLSLNNTVHTLAFASNPDTPVVGKAAHVDGAFGVYQPDFSPRDGGAWLAVGWGNTFQSRDVGGQVVVRTPADGSADFEVLAGAGAGNSSAAKRMMKGEGGVGGGNGTVSAYAEMNAGMPSYSPDGTAIVYRTWTPDGPGGLRVRNLTTGITTVLTRGWDTLPHWRPQPANSTHAPLIVFTRRTSPSIASALDDNYDICTVSSSPSTLSVLTTSGANDAHAVWTADGQSVLYSTGQYGFQDEAGLYDDQFQPYGQIVRMDWDGGNKKPLTNGIWEDAMPLFVPREVWGS